MAVTVICVAACCDGLAAQGTPQALPPADTARSVVLRLTDGSEFTGRVVARTDTSLVAVSPAGLRVEVPNRAVRSWRMARGQVVGGRFREADPNTSRLFFSPTGRTLRRGEGYVADYYLFFPFAAVGVSDAFTLAGGASILPGASSQLVYIAPKLGVLRSPRLNAAVGGIYATVPGEDGYVGAAYAVMTAGTEDHAVTVMAGYPFANGERTTEPGLVIGGESRISNRAKLLVEAWKLPGLSEVPAIVGLRFFGSRLTVDFGLLRVYGADWGEGFPFLPWVDFVVSW